MTARPWTPAEIALMRELYPNTATAELLRKLGRNERQVYQKAADLGLRKTPEFLASVHAGRIQRGKQHPSMIANWFKPGSLPWNKGASYMPGGRCAETQFKKGVMSGAAQHNYVPIGTLRISADGYLERKTTDDPAIYPARRWVAVHRLVWEAAHGPIPHKHIVVFKRGQKTAVEADITPDRLDCISRAEHARRNHPRSHNPEVGRLIQLKGAIARQVNRINREHQQQKEAA